jgi:Ca2+/Na+ antiporter
VLGLFLKNGSLKKKDKIKISAAAILACIVLLAFHFFGKENIIGKSVVAASLLLWILTMFYANKYIKD